MPEATQLETSQPQVHEPQTTPEIFSSNLTWQVKQGIASGLKQTREGQRQYEDYTVDISGVEEAILLMKERSAQIPGTEPQLFRLKLKDGNMARTVVVYIAEKEHREPDINLSSYQAAPRYTESVTVTGVTDRRRIELDDGTLVTKNFSVMETHEQTMTREAPLEIFAPIREDENTPDIEWDYEEDTVITKANGVVYTQRSDGTWTKTYVYQDGRRRIHRPLYDEYINERGEVTEQVSSLDLDETEQKKVETILKKTGNLGSVSDELRNLVGQEITRAQNQTHPNPQTIH